MTITLEGPIRFAEMPRQRTEIQAMRAASRFARRAFTAETFDESKVVREHGKFATQDGGEKTITPPSELGPVGKAAREAASLWSGSTMFTDKIQADADSLMTTGHSSGDRDVDGMGGAMMRAIELSATADVPLYRGISVPVERADTANYTPGQRVAFSLGSFTEDPEHADKFAGGMTVFPRREGVPVMFVIEPGQAKALDFDRLSLSKQKQKEQEWVTGGQFVVDKVEPFTPEQRAWGTGNRDGLRVTLRQTEAPHVATT